MLLTRQALQDGSYLRSFSDLPGQPRWSRQRILASLDAALAQRPGGQPVWLFAYGSLIWNPLFEYAERQPATLHGWQRRFCLRLHAGRGSAEQPGRMLALDRGSHCRGVAFRIGEQGLRDELALVWIREMPYGSYNVIWGRLQLAGGRKVQALTFVANPAQQQYVADACIATVAPLVARACGPMGSNMDYLLSLEKTLAQFAIHDAYVAALVQAAKRSGGSPVSAAAGN